MRDSQVQASTKHIAFVCLMFIQCGTVDLDVRYVSVTAMAAPGKYKE